jgi:hypothetical protein
MRMVTIAAAIGCLAAAPATGLAQRVPFDRSIDVLAPAVLDVTTERGAIEVTTGEPGRIVIEGTATVRAGWNVPAEAGALARAVAAQPPIAVDRTTIRLRPPSDPSARRAVTVSYRVRVPRNTRVIAASGSGATTVTGIGGDVSVRTGSAAITIGDLGGDATVVSGSGAVAIGGVRGALDVRTGSSAIHAHDLGGGVTAHSGSGHVDAAGVPRAPWRISTGSSAIDVRLDAASGLALHATSGSGSVRVAGAALTGTAANRAAIGTIGGGGPEVRLESHSGAVHVTVAAPPAGH